MSTVPSCNGKCCERIQINGGKTRAELEASTTIQDRQQILAMIVDTEDPTRFNCKNFDPWTRLCKDYENRPRMCRDYPYDGEGCALCDMREGFFAAVKLLTSHVNFDADSRPIFKENPDGK